MSSAIQLINQQTQKGVYIAQFKIKSLAIFIYYVESQKQCYLIDPTYDYIFYQEFIKKRGATLKYVVLTHYHADYVSGHGQLKVPVIMGQNSKRQSNTFQLKEMKDNQKFKIGKVQTRVLATPGHTPESACFILANEDGHQFCIFTGDTVFLREVGRPDLAVSGNVSVTELAGMLYESIQKIKALDKSLRLYPGHGSGSSCGKSIGSGDFCDLKNQAELNYAFLIQKKEDFIQTLIKDLPAPPKYFFFDAKMNQIGLQVPYENTLAKVKNPLNLQAFEKLVDSGITIIDTRNMLQNGIIKGAYWLSSSGPMCNLIPHILEPQKQFAIFVDSGMQEDIIDRFLRIGYMNILGYNDFKMAQWKGKRSVIQVKKYQQIDINSKRIVIDVRNRPEWIQTGIFEGAKCIPLPSLKSRVNEAIQFTLNNKQCQVVVHCKAGFRARLASSILAGHGIQSIISLNQNIEKIGEKGVKLTKFQEI